jgi:hypothetical protein
MLKGVIAANSRTTSTTLRTIMHVGLNNGERGTGKVVRPAEKFHLEREPKNDDWHETAKLFFKTP